MNRQRLRVVVLALLLGAVLVVGRSLQIAVVQHRAWDRVARQQHQQVIEVPSLRGQIRSSDGYVMATSVDRLAIQVDTDTLRYPELFARTAANLLGQDSNLLLTRLRTGPRSVWIAQQVEERLAQSVRALDPSAVALVPDSTRIYPLGSIAAPLLGFVGREELLTVGRRGLEQVHDSVLAGEPQQYLALRDAVARTLRLERMHQGRGGRDLELTIDARLQAACERILEEALVEFEAEAASAVVVEVSTGATLTLASVPSFDPNAPTAAATGEELAARWRLRPVQDAFEPGSTAKPIVVAASLASGTVRRGETLSWGARGITIAGHFIRDHAPAGTYTVDEIVIHSANTGVILLAQRLTPQQLWAAFDAFGFGRRPELGFPGESRGLLHPAGSWTAMSPSGVALGQELTASPLQLALAYAAIANGGWLMRPRVVAAGREELAPRQGLWRTRVMDPALAARLRDMMERVVSEGTGKQAQVAGYRAAGKTGTAQRLVGAGFDDQHHVAWFAGFLPMPEPRLAVVVAIENPTTTFWAASVAAPTFARIATTAMHLLGVPPVPPELEPAAPVHPGGVA